MDIDIPIMGFDSSENTIATDDYCMPGDLPTIKIHRKMVKLLT